MHVEAFVEKTLKLNRELHGTPFELKDPVLVTHLTTALQKHDPAYVRGFLGGKRKKNWNADFGAVWTEIKNDLDTASATSHMLSTNPTDVLATTTTPAAPPPATADDTAAKLDQVLAAITAVLATSTVRPSTPRPKCPDCGVAHPLTPGIGCVGKALATGKITMEEAKKQLTDALGVTSQDFTHLPLLVLICVVLTPLPLVFLPTVRKSLEGKAKRDEEEAVDDGHEA